MKPAKITIHNNRLLIELKNNQITAYYTPTNNKGHITNNQILSKTHLFAPKPTQLDLEYEYQNIITQLRLLANLAYHTQWTLFTLTKPSQHTGIHTCRPNYPSLSIFAILPTHIHINQYAGTQSTNIQLADPNLKQKIQTILNTGIMQ